MKKIRLVLFSLISLSLFSCASKDAAQIENEIVTPEVTELEKTEDKATITEEDKTTSTEEETTQNIENEENVPQVETSVPTAKQFVEIPEPLPEIEEPEVITLPPEEEPVKVEVIVEEPEIPAEKIEDDAIEEVEKILTDEASQVTEVSQVTEAAEVTETVEVAEASVVTEVSTVTEDVINKDSIEKAVIKPVVPSRSVTLKKLEYLDITYPGNGWIYMGITDGSKDLTYFGRKVGTENTKFSVQAKLPGTKILHFYKNDTLTNTFIDDYIEVVILDEKGSNKTHIEAPEYKVPVTVVLERVAVEEEPVENPKETPTVEPIESKPAVIKSVEDKPVVTKPVVTKPVESKPVESKPVISDDDEVSEVVEIDTSALLKEIKNLINGKKYKEASDKLLVFMENATDKRDEGLFYQGQLYEAKSEMQNIQAAINAYTTLTKNYPASKYWDDSNKRIIYLKRFYLEGR